MSALAAALAAFATTHDVLPAAAVVVVVDNSPVAGPSIKSRPPSPLSPPSLTHSGVSSSSSSLFDVPAASNLSTERPNEHLAVLLPKELWKPDNLSTHCDNFYCRAAFGIFERKHHCRRCGGIFCAACTSRTTPLLDTSNLEFLHPPRNVPISVYDSPTSPVINSRVCDDCWDQLYGIPTSPHMPSRPSMKRTLSHPISVLTGSRNTSHTSLPTRTTSPTLLKASLSRKPRSLSNSPSISSLSTSSSRTTSSVQNRSSVLRTGRLPLPAELERSYGELDAYPLRRSSVLCKATGGGRWEPKQSPVLDGYRPPVPGAKAPFEIEMERQEEEERRRRSNPIVTDGDFRYRFVRRQQPAPTPISSDPFNLSTF